MKVLMGIMLEDQEVTAACMVRAAILVTLILCSLREEVMAMLVVPCIHDLRLA